MRSAHRGKVATALIVGSSLLLLAGCTGGDGDGGGGGSLEDMEPITLTWAEQGNETAPYVPGVVSGGRYFMDYVESQTDKVIFEEYWGSSLFPTVETVPNLGAGVADFAQWSTPQSVNELPIENWYSTLGSQGDRSLAFGYLQATGATYEMHMRNQVLIDEFADNNIKLIMASANSRATLLCRDEITTLEQARGKRARVGGPVWAPEVEAMGMQPQFLPPLEIYEALQRGVLDCVALQPNGLVVLGLTEIAKHFIDLPFTSTLGYVRGVNLDTWNSFPEELQRIFMEAGALEAAQNANQNMEIFAELLLGADESGVVEDSAPELAEAIVARQAEIVAAMPESAPGGVADPQALIDEYLGYLEKWYGIVGETTPFEPGAEHGLADYSFNLPPDYDWLADYEAEFLAVANEVLAAG